MKGLDWRSAFKRAGIFTVIWLGLVYVLDAAFPQSFGIGGRQQIITLGFNAVLFFFLYAFVFAFFEKRRAQRAAQNRKGASQAQAKDPKGKPQEQEIGPLKGRYNPNTSRRKSRRRQTRR